MPGGELTMAERQRTIGFIGATGIGVGAIVGGGILVLAGAAFAATGPGAILAFALNGILALATAAAFAEMATSFPESGGGYTFAKRVLSVRAAFVVGWVLWFASIVAGVLYALGFASYAVEALRGLAAVRGIELAPWWTSRPMAVFLALMATAWYTLALARKTTGGGQMANIGKVAVLAVLTVIGLLAVTRQSAGTSLAALEPLLPSGFSGLIAAMGFSFIALQGFDLIASVAGEVKDPSRTIPRAMFASLGVALVLYLPLLFVVTVVGVAPGESISAAAALRPDTIMAVAAGRFAGPIGYWLVVVAAILATLSALHANLLAASRTAYAMAVDRTLPAVLGRLHVSRATPVMALYASALTLFGILLALPDASAAGAASSLIFLVAFALVHLTSFLARRRVGLQPGAFAMPGYPLLPILSGLACASLAVFQAVRVPSAGATALLWVGVGVLLYLSLFSTRAEAADASEEAFDPELARLRGRSSLVLVPIANPARASSLIEVANALAPVRVGRVILLTVVPPPASIGPQQRVEALGFAQAVIEQALSTSFAVGRAPEALVTAAADPIREIRRIAAEHDCDSLLLGLGPEAEKQGERMLERMIAEVDCHVAALRTPESWTLSSARRILVPVGGRGEQHELRARLLGSLRRAGDRELTFLRILPSDSKEDEAAVFNELEAIAKDQAPGASKAKLLRSNDVAATLLEEAESHDLLVMGLRRHERRIVLGELVSRVAHQAGCATILLARRKSIV